MGIINEDWRCHICLQPRYPIKIFQHDDIRIPHSRLRGAAPSANPNPISHPCSAAGHVCTAASISANASAPNPPASCEHNGANNGSPSPPLHSSFIHRGARSAIIRPRRRRGSTQGPHIADCLLRPSIRRLYSSPVPLERDVQRLVTE